MLKSTARAMAKTATGHGADDQITDPEWNRWFDLEHKLFRRELQKAFPSAYAATDSSQVIAAGSDTLTLPSDFEELVRVEIQLSSIWMPVPVSDELGVQLGDVAFREEGAAFKVGPTLLAAGTYRLVYIAKTADLSENNSPDETLLVPIGCEDILIERVAARARVNQDEDPTPHTARADKVWADQRRALKRRYGKHVVPGLRRVRAT